MVSGMSSSSRPPCHIKACHSCHCSSLCLVGRGALEACPTKRHARAQSRARLPARRKAEAVMKQEHGERPSQSLRHHSTLQRIGLRPDGRLKAHGSRVIAMLLRSRDVEQRAGNHSLTHSLTPSLARLLALNDMSPMYPECSRC